MSAAMKYFIHTNQNVILRFSNVTFFFFLKVVNKNLGHYCSHKNEKRALKTFEPKSNAIN